MSIPLPERIKRDSRFRTKLFLLLSLIANLLYATFLFIVGWVYDSKWFFVMAIYYGCLSFSRVFVLLQTSPKKGAASKIKTMRACGAFLLMINVAVSTLMFLLIFEGQVVKHHEITVIGLATYTFSSLTVAIVNTIKYVKQNDHVRSSIKIISLTSASVSMVTLTNTMLATWGSEKTLLRSVTLPMISVVVFALIVVGALLMISKANSDLRMLQDEKTRE